MAQNEILKKKVTKQVVIYTCTAVATVLSTQAGPITFENEPNALITADLTSLSLEERQVATAFTASALNISLRYLGTSQSNLKYFKPFWVIVLVIILFC